MGNSLAAAVVGPIASLVPWFFFAGLNDLVRHRFNLLIDFLGRTADAVGWPYLLQPSYVQSPSGIHYPVYDNIPTRVLVFLAITVISLCLGRAAYKQNAVEKSGELLMFPFLEPVLIYGFAVCLALLLSLVFGLSLSENRMLITDALLIGGFVGGRWLAQRVVAYYRN